ncbi:MAG: hypothetical protein KAS32_27190 [Candidatus Peribacteraceae bacterium]|nr:hypothetical protein [Candidatus Peribacteraceae bacterium]
MKDIRFTITTRFGKVALEKAHVKELYAYVGTRYRGDCNKRKPTTLLKENNYKIDVFVDGILQEVER